jgi:hypothetical protein
MNVRVKETVLKDVNSFLKKKGGYDKRPLNMLRPTIHSNASKAVKLRIFLSPIRKWMEHCVQIPSTP